MKTKEQKTFVESSLLRDVTYRPTEHRLKLTFASGAVYAYRDVPESVYSDLLAAESKGAFFNAHIRDEYSYTRLPSGRSKVKPTGP